MSAAYLGTQAFPRWNLPGVYPHGFLVSGRLAPSAQLSPCDTSFSQLGGWTLIVPYGSIINMQKIAYNMCVQFNDLCHYHNWEIYM